MRSARSGVVAFPAAAHDQRHRALLLRSGHQLVCVGLAHGDRLVLVQSILFCLTGIHPARHWALHPLAEAEGLSGPFL
jgi:hypothetical protein